MLYIKRASLVAQTVKDLCARQETWVGKIPWRREWQPTAVFLPEKSHGQRSLVSYNPWGHKVSDRTEWLTHNIHPLKGTRNHFKEKNNTYLFTKYGLNPRKLVKLSHRENIGFNSKFLVLPRSVIVIIMPQS